MINQSENELSLDEETIRVFVWSVWNFFTKSTGIEPESGAPYLFDNFENSDYTGIIGVSGIQKGVTMCKGLVDLLLKRQNAGSFFEGISGEQEEEFRIDYAGEVANIVTGNARNYLGENFRISVPVVENRPETQIDLVEGVNGVVFPISWADYRCHLILGLKRNELSA